MLSYHKTRNRLASLTQDAKLRLGLLGVTGLFAFLAIMIPTAIKSSSYALKVGDVAVQDIQAPYSLTYDSAVLTEQARQTAEASVSSVYLPADPSIARQQVETLQITLNFIDSVRADSFATRAQQVSDLSSINNLALSEDAAGNLLAMSENRWQTVKSESLRVLEEVMRDTIRENQVDEVVHSLPSMISFSLQDDQSDLVLELVTAYLVPNSLYSEDQTEAARKAAREAVQPVTTSFIEGETIINRGQIIGNQEYEALVQYGLVQPENFRDEMIGTAALVTLLMAFIGLYLYRRAPVAIDSLQHLGLIAALLVVFLLGARLIIPDRTVIPYIFPITAFGLTIAVLFNLEYGLVFTLVLNILAAYQVTNTPELALYYILSSFCGVLVLGKARRVINFFWAGLAAGLAGAAVVIAFRLPDTTTDWVGIATLIGASFFNSLLSASLALLFQFLFAQVLGMTTALQLLEISRPDHPLLQFVLRNAPGTYQHSLQVANLAEQAAEAIGADSLLTRVGALYHDAGKSINSQFFIENQVSCELNPHDDLDPATSAATIIQHIAYGLQLAQKYRLPPRINDFISEHHGTMLTRYQYTRAIESAGNDPTLVNPELFRYPGPRPRSRETALLMLADGCEARARAELPKDDTSLRLLIKRVFDYCQKEGQLDNTRLTLLDLNLAAESFYNTLRGIYHPRIAYPELQKPAVETELVTGPSSNLEQSPATAVVTVSETKRL